MPHTLIAVQMMVTPGAVTALVIGLVFCGLLCVPVARGIRSWLRGDGYWTAFAVFDTSVPSGSTPKLLGAKRTAHLALTVVAVEGSALWVAALIWVITGQALFLGVMFFVLVLSGFSHNSLAVAVARWGRPRFLIHPQYRGHLGWDEADRRGIPIHEIHLHSRHDTPFSEPARARTRFPDAAPRKIKRGTHWCWVILEGEHEIPMVYVVPESTERRAKQLVRWRINGTILAAGRLDADEVPSEEFRNRLLPWKDVPGLPPLAHRDA